MKQVLLSRCALALIAALPVAAPAALVGQLTLGSVNTTDSPSYNGVSYQSNTAHMLELRGAARHEGVWFQSVTLALDHGSLGGQLSGTETAERLTFRVGRNVQLPQGFLLSPYVRAGYQRSSASVNANSTQPALSDTFHALNFGVGTRLAKTVQWGTLAHPVTLLARLEAGTIEGPQYNVSGYTYTYNGVDYTVPGFSNGAGSGNFYRVSAGASYPLERHLEIVGGVTYRHMTVGQATATVGYDGVAAASEHIVEVSAGVSGRF